MFLCHLLNCVRSQVNISRTVSLVAQKASFLQEPPGQRRRGKRRPHTPGCEHSPTEGRRRERSGESAPAGPGGGPPSQGPTAPSLSHRPDARKASH